MTASMVSSPFPCLAGHTPPDGRLNEDNRQPAASANPNEGSLPATRGCGTAPAYHAASASTSPGRSSALFGRGCRRGRSRCQSESANAHWGMIFGSFVGRFAGRTTSGFDGALVLPAASVAITRKTLGRGVVDAGGPRPSSGPGIVSSGWFVQGHLVGDAPGRSTAIALRPGEDELAVGEVAAEVGRRRRPRQLGQEREEAARRWSRCRHEPFALRV